MKQRFALIVLVGCLTMVPIPSGATHLHVTFNDMVKRADVIFLGKVTDQTSREGAGGNMIFTDVCFEVTRLIHRSEKAEPITGGSIVLTFAGGSVGGRTVTISDVPSFETGSTYLLFTLLDGKVYASPIIGGFQGSFRVIVDEKRGTQYPLTSGSQGIRGFKNGDIVRTPPVHRVQGGAIEELQMKGYARFHDVAPAPAEGVPGMDRTRIKASVASVKNGMPTKLVTVDELVEAIHERIEEEGREER